MIPIPDNLYESLPPGGLYAGEAHLLWNWASVTTGKMLEVGSAMGRSAFLLGTLAKRQNRELICIDPWAGEHGEKLYKMFVENIKGLPIITARQRIEDWKPEPVDFAYLDGDHSYEGTKTQIEKALAAGASVIAIHDYGEEHGELLVQAATRDMLGRRPTVRVERMAIYWLK